MIDLRSEGLQANTGARHPPATPYATTTPGESAVMFGVIIPVPMQKCFLICWVGLIHYYTPPVVEAAMCGQAAFWSDPDCENDTPSTTPTSG